MANASLIRLELIIIRMAIIRRRFSLGCNDYDVTISTRYEVEENANYIVILHPVEVEIPINIKSLVEPTPIYAKSFKLRTGSEVARIIIERKSCIFTDAIFKYKLYLSSESQFPLLVWGRRVLGYIDDDIIYKYFT